MKKRIRVPFRGSNTPKNRSFERCPRIEHPHGWLEFVKTGDNRFVYYDGLHPDGFLKFSVERTPKGHTRVTNHESNHEYTLDKQGRVAQIWQEDIKSELKSEAHRRKFVAVTGKDGIPNP